MAVLKSIPPNFFLMEFQTSTEKCFSGIKKKKKKVGVCYISEWDYEEILHVLKLRREVKFIKMHLDLKGSDPRAGDK